MSFWKWSKTAIDNDNIDPSINWEEGQAPSTVNDSSRSMMAALAKYRDDTAGVVVGVGSLIASGTITRYDVTTNQGFSVPPPNGATFTFTPDITNAGPSATSIAVDGSYYWLMLSPGINLPANSLFPGTPYTCTYKTGADHWVLHGFFNSGAQPFAVPVGGMMDYIGVTTPSLNFIFPVGQYLNIYTYGVLYSRVGISYGALIGDTFPIPDLQGRVVAGKDNMSGVSADRMTNVINGDILGAAGGADAVVLSILETPVHAHHLPGHYTNTIIGGHNANHGHGNYEAPSAPQNNSAASGSGQIVRATGAVAINTTDIDLDHQHYIEARFTDNNGSSLAHSNTQPTIVLNKILRII